MSAPHVTITVKGSGPTLELADAATAESGLHMLYLQSLEGDKRHQWIVFPPALEVLGVEAQTVAASAGKVKVLNRTQEFAGNRAKWFHQVRDADLLLTAIKSCEASGQIVSEPVVIPLELDDYQKVWQGETSHKAIRAIDRVIQSVLGTNVKGKD